MKNVKYLVVLVLLGGVIGGCGKDSPTPSGTNNTNSSGNCRVATLKMSPYAWYDTLSYSYEYNSVEKISKLSVFPYGGVSFYSIYDYSNNGVVDKKTFYADGTQYGHTILTLGSNGFVSSETDSMFNRYDTILFEYNSTGYMIKRMDKGDNELTTYTITNGNITQKTLKDSLGKTRFTTTLEYSDKPDKIGNQYSFFGKGNANLISKETTSGKNASVTTYSYTFDSNGYPLEVIETTNNGSSVDTMKTKYTYTCP